MGTSDYMPRTHDGFFRWQGDFYARVSEKMNSFKIDAEKLKAVTAAKSKYEQAYAKASNPDGSNTADRVERNEREAAYKAEIRPFVNENIRYNSAVSDYDKTYLGLNVPDTTPTPAPMPGSSPVARVTHGERLQHVIHFSNEGSAGKAKPTGVKGCEIWKKIGGEAPVKASELSYVATPSSTPYTVSFEGDLEGQRVYYWLRWVNTREQHGPWSATESAVIA